MLSLLVSLIPIALAGAMSTVPVSVTIIILLSPNAHRGALSFLIGSIAGAVLLVGGATVGLRFLPVRAGADQNTQLAVLGLFVAALVIAYAVYVLSRTRTTDSAVLGGLRTRVASARPWEFLVLGLAVNLRPKAVLLSLTAGALIGLQDLQLLAGTLFVLGYVLAAQSEILVPIVLRMRRPERADAMLTGLDRWMRRHSRTITGVTLLLVGLFVAGLSVARL
ncbi:GAP family protein [Arthrobacter agilis]|uniref:GAP family protein n=1 Tax=Arthrobacter agilis TaxID=37921 RepID=UPI002786A19D|nr:GAP family protein [Arthrobacter agilis]MDQ0734478.1 putative membrane protein YiaA [Arthrobacter agilis]